MSDTPNFKKLKNRLTQMRDRIESLRGLCKTAVGYLRDENAEKQATEIANLIGDMEPPLIKTLDMVSELAAERERADADCNFREMERFKEQQRADAAVNFLKRYRTETPIWNQPHMIAHEVDEFLAALTAPATAGGGK